VKEFEIMSKKYVADKPVQLSAAFRGAKFYRADIKFHEVDHSGATYEGRVFLNNPNADEGTPKTLANGYAGSFHIFGHGGCFGDMGHCDVPTTQRPFDNRDEHPLVPAEISVTITDALREAVKKGSQVHVTVVPVILSANDKCDLENVLKFKNFEIVTYGS